MLLSARCTTQTTPHTWRCSITTSGGGLPAGIENLITLPGFDPPSTHGPAMCLSAHLRRHPTPVGALFAAVPEWAMEHTLGTHRARLQAPCPPRRSASTGWRSPPSTAAAESRVRC
ncbi:hypothetical protein ACFQ60_48100 [Streptomyces zhihengii]